MLDPLDWTNEHIASWLEWCVKQLKLCPVPISEDFPKTGRELCLLDRAEFDRRSQNKRSGRLLLLHLSLLRQPVTGKPPSPSLTVPEEGKYTYVYLMQCISVHSTHWQREQLSLKSVLTYYVDMWCIKTSGEPF